MPLHGSKCDRYNNLELAYASENMQSKHWYKSIKFLSFLNNLDIFAFYKTRAYDSKNKSAEKTDISDDEAQTIATSSAPKSEQRATISKFRCKELKMAENREDLRLKRWARPIRIFFVYMLIKTWLIAIAQFSLLKHRILVPRGYSAPWLSADAALTIGRYLGNPLRDLRDVSLVAYLAPTSFCVIWLVWFPAYLKKRPLDVAPLRFLFEPCHELKRVDSAIKQRVSDVKLSLWMYMNQRIDKLFRGYVFRCESQFGLSRQRSLNEFRDLINREQLYYIELDKFLSDLSSRRLETLRPATYSVEHYLGTTAKIGAIVIGAQLQYFGVWLITTIVTETFVYNHNCAEFLQNARFRSKHNSSSSTSLSSYEFCNPLHIFTLPDLIGLVELPTTNFMVASIVALNIILAAIVNSNQTKLIKSLKHLMNSCKGSILQYNQSFDSVNAAKCNDNVQGHQALLLPSTLPLHSHPWRLEQAGSLDPVNLQSEMVFSQGRRESITSRACHTRFERIRSIGDRLEFDRFLLESLIRVMVCEQELADNSRCLSLLTQMTFHHLIVATFFAAAGEILGVSDPYYIRAYFLFVGCASFNFGAASCARLYSRVIELQRILWTILAAKAQILAGRSQLHKSNREKDYSDEDGIHYDTLGTLDTFAMHLWRKFALATSSGIERFCVRPHGFRFTYGNVIRANFFFISCFVLARGHL